MADIAGQPIGTASPDSLAVCCRGLRKQFGSVTAVGALDLDVRQGELFGFLGPNGAGKTTTIRMLTGLLQPSGGVAMVAGHDVTSASREARSAIGYVPDNAFLYERLTGREFLNFMADLYSTPRAGRAVRIGELLAQFQMTEKADALIQGYSRGMRQKIAMAGALVHSPRVLFLDEPTVGLDPGSARLMKDTLRRLCDQGTTTFMSTHVLEVAERICDRFAIINRGSIVAEGTMEDLRSRSASEAGSLEDIFLELTGGDEYRELVRNLT